MHREKKNEVNDDAETSFLPGASTDKTEARASEGTENKCISFCQAPVTKFIIHMASTQFACYFNMSSLRQI